MTAGAETAAEWGLPDWRDPAAYGDVKRWGFDRWRWEFYRRREDLRAYFDSRAEETYQHWKQYAGEPGFPAAHLKPHEPGFCATVDVEARKRFGYSALPNPRTGEQPSDLIRPYDHGGVGNYITGDQAGYKGFRGTIGEILEQAGVALNEEQAFILDRLLGCFPAPIEQHEIVLTFDLDRALEPQVAHAREMLHGHQSYRHGKSLQIRRHPGKWLGYLRTLDARETGASWSDITDLHPSTAQTEQTARDIWVQARALCFNFGHSFTIPKD